MSDAIMKVQLALAGAAVALAATAATAADPALERAAAATGATGLKTLRYAGDGVGYTFGQPFKPELAWPKIRITSFVRSIDYEAGAMRTELFFQRAEALGGGGYPHVAPQRNEEYLSGGYTWNVVGGAPVPGPRYLIERTHQLWVTPQGVVKAALRNNAAVRTVTEKGRPLTTATFTEPGKFAATVYIDGSGLVERVESRIPDPVLGETTAVTRYSQYRDFGGVKFPARIEQSQGGYPTLDLAVRSVEANPPVDIALPDSVRNASERIATEKVADGVWFLGGGSHNSVVVEMKDYVVLVESPLNDGRAVPVLEQAKKLVPGKPVRYLINSHAHFDHTGGVRAAAAEGAIVVTQAGNKAYLERALATRGTINPDRLDKSGRKARFLTVDEKRVLSDGTRSIELYRIRDSHHTDSMLIAYLPKEKLLIEADAFTPGPPNAPAPAQPNPNNTNLVDNLARLKLDVERILPLHGRVVPVGELYTAVGMKSGN